MNSAVFLCAGRHKLPLSVQKLMRKARRQLIKKAL